MQIQNTTYARRIGDVLPGQFIASAGGNRYRVAHSKRVRRGAHELTLIDVNTGLATLRVYGSDFIVKVFEFDRVTA